MFDAKILCDSVSETGKRLTTMEVTFPRCVLAEAETHRVISGWDSNVDIDLYYRNVGINVEKSFSRNSASSRAIPIEKMLERVRTNPFIPEKWGKPAKGMGAKEYWPLDSKEHDFLTNECLAQLTVAQAYVYSCKDLANKEDLNRYLEPFMWHTAIITSTEWDNFFKLRTNEGADWKIRKVADLMYDAYHAWDKNDDVISTHRKTVQPNYEGGWEAIRPQQLKVGEWHLPLINHEDHRWIDCYLENELNIEYLTLNYFKHKNKETDLTTFKLDILKAVSVARCARVSYLTHDGKRDIEEDLKLFERLRTSGHWSPFEHVATPYFENVAVKTIPVGRGRMGMLYAMTTDKDVPTYEDKQSGNFTGWKQYRKEFADENCTHFRKES
jgi:hypothetical protein